MLRRFAPRNGGTLRSSPGLPPPLKLQGSLGVAGTGRSSTQPQPIVSIIAVSGILDHPPRAQLRTRRVMTTEYDFAILQHDADGSASTSTPCFQLFRPLHRRLIRRRLRFT